MQIAYCGYRSIRTQHPTSPCSPFDSTLHPHPGHSMLEAPMHSPSGSIKEDVRNARMQTSIHLFLPPSIDFYSANSICARISLPLPLFGPQCSDQSSTQPRSICTHSSPSPSQSSLHSLLRCTLASKLLLENAWTYQPALLLRLLSLLFTLSCTNACGLCTH